MGRRSADQFVREGASAILQTLAMRVLIPLQILQQAVRLVNPPTEGTPRGTAASDGSIKHLCL
jgi:hypothetical protein